MSYTKKVAFMTLGCKVNQYETASIKKTFLDNSYEEVDFESKADVYIVNSCTVTSIADRKTRNFLRRAKRNNPDSLVVVTGCYAQTNGEELSKIEEIDIVIDNTKKDRVYEIVSECREDNVIEDIFKEEKYLEMDSSVLREMTRAYIKIQDGCNNFCSYCKIPFARGKSRSREWRSIIEEVKKLVDEGYQEFILIGINLGDYGKDLYEEINFSNILEKVLLVKGVKRVRIGSIYPDKIDNELILLFENYSNLMPHFHISLQSGDSDILNRMNRDYTREEVMEKLLEIKRRVKNANFTCDIIVGFPGETDENFKNSYNLIKEIAFSDTHIFQYSDRKKTAAFDYKDKITPEIKKERAKILEELRKTLFEKRRVEYIGKEEKVLIEMVKNGRGYGYTENYFRVRVEGYSGEVNRIVLAKIKLYEKGMLIAHEKI